MSDKWLSSSTTGDHVHHGSLNLEETEVVQEASHVVDDLGPLDEDVTHVVVHDQVQVTLAVSSFCVSEPSLGSFGKHVQVGRKQLDRRREDGQLASLGLAGRSHDSDNVTTSQKIVGSKEVAFLVVLQSSHDLDLDSLAVQVVEAELLTRRSHVVDTSGDADLLTVMALPLLRTALVLLDEVSQARGDVELVRIWVWVPGLPQLLDSATTALVVLRGRQLFLLTGLRLC